MRTTLPWLWATLLGLSGFAFPMAMTLITLRTRDPHVTTQLSGFMQSLGYLASGAGPLIVGVLFALWFHRGVIRRFPHGKEVTGGTRLAAVFLILLWMVIMLCGRWIAYAPV